MNSFFLRLFFRVWYWYISTLDKNGDVICMNYGYTDGTRRIPLDAQDEKNRYSLQLYHLVATGADLVGKNVLEVGSGRGGGLSYVSRYLNPLSLTGAELNKKAVRFCNRYYIDSTIRFVQSDAQQLTFADQTFDRVINIESSHGYRDMNQFLAEVYRVLRPGGYFLFADFRPQTEIEDLKLNLVKSHLVMIKEQVITSQVLLALKNTTEQRKILIEKLIPKFLHAVSRKFAAIEGTSMFNSFLNGKYQYVYYVLQK